MNPLRIAWKQRARMDRADANHLRHEGHLLAWQGRVVVPAYAGPGGQDLGVILDRNGEQLHAIAAPPPHTRYRIPTGPVVTWPDEGLVAGVHADAFQLMWIDLDGAHQLVATQLAQRTTAMQRHFELVPATDGAVLVSAPSELANLDGVGWSLDLRLESMYGTLRRAPFEDFEYVTECAVRAGAPRWHAPGRVACVADDVVMMEEGGGARRHVVARRVGDGGELWRREGVDRFVLGTIPMPAWSDDRVYVLDRGARRKQAWRREEETVRIHGIAADAPMRTILSVRAASRARDEQPLTAPSVISCMSTRSGDPLWHANLDGDVVSFHCHARWVAAVVAGRERGTLHVWRHDGTPIGEGAVDAVEPAESTWWPPSPERWPCIAWGDDEHVVIAQNRSKRQGDSRLYAAPLADPATPRWQLALPVACVSSPQFRWLRLLNRVPMAFTADAAFLRWGKLLYGLLS